MNTIEESEASLPVCQGDMLNEAGRELAPSPEATPITWFRYGVAEYLLSTRIRPKLLTDPNRFTTLPVQNRHCDDLALFLKLQSINDRALRRLSRQ